MGLLNYLGGRGSSGYGEGSSTIMIAIGFLDTLADPEEGRRVLGSCGVKVTRLRSTLTALLVWFVLVSLVRALALTVFEVVTDFNAERGNVENGKV